VIPWSPAERISAPFSTLILLIRAVLKESRRLNVAVIHVDLFVNNAGFSLSGEFLSHDPRQEQAEVEVNVQALVALTLHFAKQWLLEARPH
jgi:short-subunit dehydrogenase